MSTSKVKTAIVWIVAVAAVLAVTAAAVAAWLFVIVPTNRYHDGVSLYKAGNYQEAIAVFEELGDFKDSREQIEACHTAINELAYQDAQALVTAGKYQEAILAFEALADFKDSKEKIQQCSYRIRKLAYEDAVALLEATKYAEAIQAFEALGDFEDSKAKVQSIKDLLLTMEWKKAYRDYIKKLKNNGYVRFALIYVDDDNIPELYAEGNCEAAGELICTYYNKKVVKASFGRLYGTSYSKHSGLILHDNGHMGYYYTDLYRLKDGKFTRVHKSTMTETGYDYVKEAYSYEYTVDGKKCSESAHRKKIAAWTSGHKMTSIYKNAVSYTKMKEKLKV